ncbi:MAG: hypothetical protein CSA26_09355 [Desulfobacterales bacterium]|nr:MAG: hypothetical protein CSA26_09355 [Desulfobacterales bacterium]
MNKSQWMVPPLLIDPETVERIEVVKGAGSVLYGSEAIGGVVNIITKKGSEKPFGAVISSAYNSGTSGYEGSLGLYGSVGGAYYRITGSYSDQGERETPDGALKESDSQMQSVSGVLGYKNKQFDAGVIVETYKVEADVPPLLVMGAPFDLNLPEWSREKVGVYADFKDITDFFAKVHIDSYYQKTFKDFRQYTERPLLQGPKAGGPKAGRPKAGGQNAGRPRAGGPKAGGPKMGGHMGMRPMMIGSNLHTDNDQKTYAINAQVDMLPGSSHYVIGGVSFSNDTLDAETDISFTMPFIPSMNSFQEASINTWAVYLQDEWSLTDDVVFTFGVRETWVESELEKANDPRIKPGTISDSHPAFSAGVTWNSTENLTLRSIFSQGYRFPDLGKLFIGTRHGGSTTLPNQDLDPETSNNFELGARYDDNRLKVDLALFYNMAENYINRQPFGPGVYRYENVDKAKTIGMEMWVGYRFDTYNLMPYLNGTIMRRQYEDGMHSTWDTDTPLFSGRVGVRYERALASKPADVWADLYLRGAGEAEEEIAAGTVITTDGWMTTNFAIGINWGENDEWKASLNFNNIFDERYVTAQNALVEAGMHVIARLSFSF